jgi:Large eukaryotic DNA virus major capsid protein
VQPYDNVDSSATGSFFGPQYFNFTDDFDVTYTAASAFSVSDAYGGVVDPRSSQYPASAALAGGAPGVAAGGANNVFIPVSFEGGENPTAIAKIQLNGHDRFTEMDGRYFNLVQPYQHHENVPSRGINVYSFGLKPEEHQPSGTYEIVFDSEKLVVVKDNCDVFQLRGNPNQFDYASVKNRKMDDPQPSLHDRKVQRLNGDGDFKKSSRYSLVL